MALACLAVVAADREQARTSTRSLNIQLYHKDCDAPCLALGSSHTHRTGSHSRWPSHAAAGLQVQVSMGCLHFELGILIPGTIVLKLLTGAYLSREQLTDAPASARV